MQNYSTVTELVDVLVSGTSFSNGVGVRVSPISPKDSTNVHFYTNSLQILTPQYFTHIPLVLQSVSKIQFFLIQKRQTYLFKENTFPYSSS